MIHQQRINKPHIILVVSRGEAVRNFLYSDTLVALHKQARVTLLSVIDDERFLGRFRPYTEQIIPLKYQQESSLVLRLRAILEYAHFRWLWSKVAQNVWETRDERSITFPEQAKWCLMQGLAYILGNRPTLERLTEVERYLSWRLRPSDCFIKLFQALQPDLVFNCSHIHGMAGELPVKIAHRMGISTAGFIFSWDNLTSRSRIFVPYDYYFVWHEGMKQQLLSLYPAIDSEQVLVTGTPQFDFHFKPEYLLSRAELAKRIGIDAERPFIFYTAGIDVHFPEEHRHVAFIADFLAKEFSEVQLVVRTYVKGTSAEMKALAAENRPNVIFPDVAWDDKWFMPMYEDLAVYSSCLYHAAMGINPASTVSLELMMFDKPVMNIGFDPPGSNLTPASRWERHINFDHYRPIVESGGIMVAYSTDDMERIIKQGLDQSCKGHEARKRFIQQTFGSTLDGQAGIRVAHMLVKLTSKNEIHK